MVDSGLRGKDSMGKQTDEMEKFAFLLGDWVLEYNIPESSFSNAATATGTGTFKRTLNEKYVFFDYEGEFEGQKGGAHGVFRWDEKAKIYKYWWFESSGAFMQASCNFTDENTLFMVWHDTLLRQTFKKVGPDKIILRMENASSEENYELVLEVILTRR
jgi:hypothetical protein